MVSTTPSRFWKTSTFQNRRTRKPRAMPLWELAGESAGLPLQHAQLVPEFLLGIGDIAAQMTCKVIGHCQTPTPNPSPQGGRGNRAYSASQGRQINRR